ncbi:competence protein ComK [Bacillus dakarensis]|uniref:competence protein ComK n=1 Tax=Robertmurraya dakarensis TaxID=1926278 RepID=UPI00098238A8|nr:competence protein ComK [Bacillus dakarensis]
MDQTHHLVDKYEINSSTMTVMPLSYGSKVYSKIFEFEAEFISPFKPLEIIKESCGFFGSSFEGRKEGTRKLTGVTHKVPIAISPSNFIYFFPTSSPENMDCIWIAYHHIFDYKKGEQNSTIIKFKNNQFLQVPISTSSFQNQLVRTVMLKSKLTQHIDETNQHSNFKNYLRISTSAEKSNQYKL